MELRKRLESSQPTQDPVVSSQKLPVRVRPSYRHSIFKPSLDQSERWFWLGLVTVTVAALVTRLYSITEPHHVA